MLRKPRERSSKRWSCKEPKALQEMIPSISPLTFLVKVRPFKRRILQSFSKIRLNVTKQKTRNRIFLGAAHQLSREPPETSSTL